MSPAPWNLNSTLAALQIIVILIGGISVYTAVDRRLTSIEVRLGDYTAMRDLVIVNTKRLESLEAGAKAAIEIRAKMLDLLADLHTAVTTLNLRLDYLSKTPARN